MFEFFVVLLLFSIPFVVGLSIKDVPPDFQLQERDQSHQM